MIDFVTVRATRSFDFITLNQILHLPNIAPVPYLIEQGYLVEVIDDGASEAEAGQGESSAERDEFGAETGVGGMPGDEPDR